MASQLSAWLGAMSSGESDQQLLANLCYTAGVHRTQHDRRAGIVFTDRQSLAVKLAAAGSVSEAASPTPSKRTPIVFVYSGHEAQWWGGDRNPAAKRFRRVLHELELKQTPPQAKGGWRCYITNVIKEANLAGEQAASGNVRRMEQARAWAEILLWELESVQPRHVFAVGGRAYEVLRRLQLERLLPRFDLRRICHYSDRGPGRTDEAVVADMKRSIQSVIHMV